MPLLSKSLKKNSKFFFVFESEAKIYKTLVFRYFSAAAPGSGGEQLTPISNMKFDRSLTHPSMVKV
jgi:hypothetical protein